MKTERPKFTVAECLDKLMELDPRLHEAARVDRSWVWICTKVRKKDFGEDIGKKLWALGFRATRKPGGHPIKASGEVGWWGNACTKPTPFYRGGKAKTGQPAGEQVEEIDSTILDALSKF